MAIQTGNKVKFFYAASTTALPAKNSRDDDTIYFDQQAKEIYIGKNDAIAANNAAQDLSSYVSKENAEIEDNLFFVDSSDAPKVSIFAENDKFVFCAGTSTNTYAKLVAATPTTNSDVATKAYVDSNNGPTWTIG